MSCRIHVLYVCQEILYLKVGLGCYLIYMVVSAFKTSLFLLHHTTILSTVLHTFRCNPSGVSQKQLLTDESYIIWQDIYVEKRGDPVLIPVGLPLKRSDNCPLNVIKIERFDKKDLIHFLIGPLILICSNLSS